jgi:hypothetical protein
MARFLLSAERINPSDNTSYLVGKENNRTVAVVTRDDDGLHCMRCPGKRASEGVGQCAHILAVQEFEKPATPMPLSDRGVQQALADLLDQAARSDDGNYFSGATIDNRTVTVVVVFPNLQRFDITIDERGK